MRKRFGIRSGGIKGQVAGWTGTQGLVKDKRTVAVPVKCRAPLTPYQAGMKNRHRRGQNDMRKHGTRQRRMHRRQILIIFPDMGEDQRAVRRQFRQHPPQQPQRPRLTESITGRARKNLGQRIKIEDRARPRQQAGNSPRQRGFPNAAGAVDQQNRPQISPAHASGPGSPDQTP